METGTFVPNDIDIWVHNFTNREENATDEWLRLKKSTNLLYKKYLEGRGYHEELGDINEEGYKTGRLSKVIGKIYRFKNNEGKKVQVINTLVTVKQAIGTFDFDICMRSWNVGESTNSKRFIEGQKIWTVVNSTKDMKAVVSQDLQKTKDGKVMFRYVLDGEMTEREKV